MCVRGEGAAELFIPEAAPWRWPLGPATTRGPHPIEVQYPEGCGDPGIPRGQGTAEQRGYEAHLRCTTGAGGLVTSLKRAPTGREEEGGGGDGIRHGDRELCSTSRRPGLSVVQFQGVGFLCTL